MKKAFPGDPEFSWDRFYQLPYEYVLLGFYKLMELHRDALHEMELPIALNTAVYANSQRDPKSQKKPLGPLDFAMYKRPEATGPAGYYAACYLKLVETKQMPPWALFCLKDVAPSASGTPGPIYAFIADDAIFVGPRETDTGYKGLLIALESASGATRNFRDPEGNIRKLTLPIISTKVIAKEDVTLN